MKYNISNYLSAAMLFAAVTFTSCGDNADYTVLENQAYIAQTNTNGNSSQKLTLGNEAISTTVNVRLSSPADNDCTFQLTVDEAALEAFNKLNSTSYKVLPTEFYSLSSETVDVKAGQAVSDPIRLTLTPLSAEAAGSGSKFAVPLRLKSADGQKEVLQSGSVMIYEVDRVVIQPVMKFNYYSYPTFTLGQEAYNINEWTAEMNINMDKLGTYVGQFNNQAIFSWNGPSSEIYVRFGDAPIKGNILQCKTQGSQMNSNMEFNANTWYHIAIVCSGTKLYFYVNGVLDNSMDLPGKPYTLTNAFSCGGTSYFVANAMMGELRVWTKARSQSEIANNMYSCDPKSEGLAGYFKLDEGEGTDLKDATDNGGSGTVGGSRPFEWIQNVRLDGKSN